MNEAKPFSTPGDVVSWVRGVEHRVSAFAVEPTEDDRSDQEHNWGENIGLRALRLLLATMVSR